MSLMLDHVILPFDSACKECFLFRVLKNNWIIAYKVTRDLQFRVVLMHDIVEI